MNELELGVEAIAGLERALRQDETSWNIKRDTAERETSSGTGRSRKSGDSLDA